MNLAQSITLSVVSHGHGELLLNLLEDLDEAPSLKGATVVVTLNLPGEQLAIERFANLRIEIIRNTSPRGFGANHNQAFQVCGTPWFAILNPDLRVPATSFPDLLADVLDDPASPDLMAPRVVNPAGTLEDSVRGNLTPWSVALRVARRVLSRSNALPPDGSRFQWFAGMFYLIRSSAYDAIGGFDERYYLYCEDFDLCARLHLAGARLLHARHATVIHDARRDSHRAGRHLKLHLRSMARVWSSSPVWKIALENVGLRRPPARRGKTAGVR